MDMNKMLFMLIIQIHLSQSLTLNREYLIEMTCDADKEFAQIPDVQVSVSLVECSVTCAKDDRCTLLNYYSNGSCGLFFASQPLCTDPTVVSNANVQLFMKTLVSISY